MNNVDSMMVFVSTESLGNTYFGGSKDLNQLNGIMQ